MSGETKAIVDGPPAVACELPLGRPGVVVHNELTLNGWAASPKGIAGVAVQIGDRQWNASYGFDSPWLSELLPGMPGTDRCGYRLDVDTSGWPPGSHYVTVAAFDREGGRSAVEGQVEIRPYEPAASTATESLEALAGGKVAMSLEAPPASTGVSEVDGALEISGWAYSHAGIEGVFVTLDRTVRYEALRPVACPRLLADFGQEAAANAGFVLRVDPADCPPGRHHLTVVAVASDGHATGLERELSVRPRPRLEQPRSSPDLDIDWMADRAAPTAAPDPSPDSGDLAARAEMWEARALLAEADAALSRAEARVARKQQEGLAVALAHARTTLDDLGAAHEALSAAHDEARRGLLSYEQSLSWRMTRPLRSAKRALASTSGRRR